MEPTNGSNTTAITVAIYAALTYDIISATNSSPQTTEINANTRADTLMKWVHLGLAQAALFVALGVMLDKRRWPPLVGGGLAGVMLYAQYVHAKQSGLENSDQPGTETTSPAPVQPGFTESEEPEISMSPFANLPSSVA